MKAYESGTAAYFATPPGILARLLILYRTRKLMMLIAHSKPHLCIPRIVDVHHEGSQVVRGTLQAAQGSQQAHQGDRCRARPEADRA